MPRQNHPVILSCSSFDTACQTTVNTIREWCFENVSESQNHQRFTSSIHARLLHWCLHQRPEQKQLTKKHQPPNHQTTTDSQLAFCMAGSSSELPTPQLPGSAVGSTLTRLNCSAQNMRCFSMPADPPGQSRVATRHLVNKTRAFKPLPPVATAAAVEELLKANFCFRDSGAWTMGQSVRSFECFLMNRSMACRLDPPALMDSRHLDSRSCNEAILDVDMKCV